MIFRIVMALPPLLTMTYWIRFFVIHWKLKEYFWRTMPDEDTAVINGGWTQWSSFNPPWSKKKRDFIRHRNKVLLKFDRERAKRFIEAERKMDVAKYLLIITLWLLGLTCVATAE